MVGFRHGVPITRTYLCVTKQILSVMPGILPGRQFKTRSSRVNRMILLNCRNRPIPVSRQDFLAQRTGRERGSLLSKSQRATSPSHQQGERSGQMNVFCVTIRRLFVWLEGITTLMIATLGVGSMITESTWDFFLRRRKRPPKC